MVLSPANQRQYIFRELAHLKSDIVNIVNLNDFTDSSLALLSCPTLSESALIGNGTFAFAFTIVAHRGGCDSDLSKHRRMRVNRKERQETKETIRRALKSRTCLEPFPGKLQA